jgi:hypothetical protein
MRKENQKYIHDEPKKMTDERGRIWFMELGKLTNMDITDADRGLMGLSASMDFGGTGQGIQCILDSPYNDENNKFVKRLGTVFAGELIRQLVNTFGGINSLSDFNNKYWYALYEKEPGLGGGYIRGIAHPTNKSEYIIFTDVLDEVKGLDWTKDQKDD